MQENYRSASVLPIGKTARILSNSRMFGNNMLSADFIKLDDDMLVQIKDGFKCGVSSCEFKPYFFADIMMVIPLRQEFDINIPNINTCMALFISDLFGELVVELSRTTHYLLKKN
ncbi:hypothetical protein GQR58_027940 [Nymphon striatum]|nr:hypothetical protein GQR58_027940 [Nymphon striatum]